VVVPEGTEIKIEVPQFPHPRRVYAARVVAPVRVGFATAIPALSTATVQVVTRHTHIRTGVGTADTTWVTSKRLRYAGSRRQLPTTCKATRLATWGGPSPSELTFKLLKPLLIER